MSAIRTSSSPDPLAKLRIRRSEHVRGGRGVWWKYLLGMLLLIIVVVGGYAGALRNGWLTYRPAWLPIPELMQPRIEVQLVTLQVEKGRSGDAAVVASGYVESRRQARIGARAPGRVEIVYVEEGSRVTEGQVLAVLEHADLDASLAATEAMLKRAQAELLEQEVAISRAKRDFVRAGRTRQSVSEAEYDQAQFELRAAEARMISLEAAVALATARVHESEQMKENMFIRAPFDGTVVSKDAEVGESILPGGMGEASGRGSAVTIADLDHLEIDCDVKEDYISRVRPGQMAEVTVDAVPDKRYRGRVRKIIPMGDRARATIKVKVEILDVDDRLFPEMSGTVFFLPEESPELANPSARRLFCERQAILEDETGPFVWLIGDDSRLRRQAVTVGQERDGMCEIESGLTEGDRVVSAPPDVQPGQLVMIVPPS